MATIPAERIPRIPCFAMLVLLTVMGPAACGNGTNGGGGMGKSGTGNPVTVDGTIRYEDRTFDETGFTGKSLEPVRHARIELVREADEAVLTSGSTGADGTYSLTFTNTGSAGVYVSVLAEALDGVVSVRSNTGALYALASGKLDDAESEAFTVDLTASIGDGGGIFNILDVVLEGAFFVRDSTGEPPSPLTAVWRENSCDGTYYNPFEDSIHILGGCQGDADEYDDTVVLHEYGHFVAAHFSRDDSPGGIHFLDDSTQDIRLAWSEGWGNFFPAVVRNNPLYVDTIGSVAAIAFEIEGPTSPMNDLEGLSDLAIHSTNELAVASFLWDAVDASPEEILPSGPEDVSAGMGPVWDVLSVYIPCADCGAFPVSLERFWDGWFERGHGFSSEWAAVVSDRKMAFFPDESESDDAPASAAAIAADAAPQNRTLYPAGDLDFIRWEAEGGKTYTIETLGLTNGADTRLDLLDSNGTVLDGNDNADGTVSNPFCGVNFITQESNCPSNDETALSSKIVVSPPADTVYFLRAGRSTAPPPSAGRYGGYQIRITTE